MPKHTLNPDALRMEESFFAEENAKLLHKLRNEAKNKERRDALRAALRIDDEGVIDALVELDLYPETVVAFGLIPLIEVAWADWEIQDKEREAVLKAAYDRGIEPGSTTCELLENWLLRRPGPEMLETWKHYVGVIVEKTDPNKCAMIRDGILAQAKGVAEAAGGFLGFGSKISAVEQKVLDDLAAAFE
ncbi:MAG: hypothetical protein DRJ61_08310 [Acidobacteria bacterium]|nr:MAG: hypothetical protein DRJ61_08310 [Acidobacteriota bacterium]